MEQNSFFIGLPPQWSNGNPIQTNTTNSRKEMMLRDLVKTVRVKTFEAKENGNNICMGQIIDDITYIFNKQGYLTNLIYGEEVYGQESDNHSVSDNDGEYMKAPVIGHDKIEYDNNKNVTRTASYDEHGSLLSETKHKYDENGNEIEETSFDVSLGYPVCFKSEFVYDGFDGKNNWIKRVTYIDEDLTVIEVRDIEYFD